MSPLWRIALSGRIGCSAITGLNPEECFRKFYFGRIDPWRCWGRFANRFAVAAPNRKQMAKRQVKPVGQIIREARLQAELTLRDVERLTGLDPSQLSQIEMGKRRDPGFSTIARIAEGLGLSLDALAARAGLGTRAAATDIRLDSGTKATLDTANALAEAKRNAERTLAAIDNALENVPKRRR
jgi:transcriptional regulator with XRE-family HTH domain